MGDDWVHCYSCIHKDKAHDEKPCCDCWAGDLQNVRFPTKEDIGCDSQ